MIHFQVEAVAEGSAADSVSCSGVPDDPPCACTCIRKSIFI